MNALPRPRLLPDLDHPTAFQIQKHLGETLRKTENLPVGPLPDFLQALVDQLDGKPPK